MMVTPSTLVRCLWMDLSLLAAVLALGALPAEAQTTIPLATATGGIAVHYNDNGGGEVPTNGAYLRAQFDATNTNGALVNFDSTPLPGLGVSFYDIFQAVPDQFGLDIIAESPTSDGTTPTPVLTAYDNTNGSIGGRAPAGPVTWAISGYTGSTDGPGDPLNDIINSLLRGGTGDPGDTFDGLVSPANTLDGSITNLTQNLSVVGTVWTNEVTAELNTDGFIHWYSPPAGSSPITSFGLTGKLFLEATLTYDSSTDTDPLMDFYAGSGTISAEVLCGDRFVETTGDDTANLCVSAGSPCLTVQHAVNFACPGDTVFVGPGVFEEQVRIERSVNLVGSGAGSTTILAPAQASRATEDADHGFGLRTYDYLVGVFGTGAETVDISGFTLDGNLDAKSSGPGTFRSQALTFFNADGTIEGNEVIDWQDPSAFGAQGVGAVAVGSLTPQTVTLRGNTITGYQKVGIAAFGSGAVTANIEDNVITGAGAITTTAQNGIQVSNGATGVVSGNQVSGNYYSPKTWCATGILVLSDGVTVRANTLTGNLCDLLAQSHNNILEGNDIPAATDWPFSVLGDGNVVDKNHVNGTPAEGVYVDGINNSLTCNRITGNGTGLAFDVFSTPGTPNAANSNVIAGNTVGIDASAVVTLPLIDGTGNYWGCPTGADSPGCDTKVGSVDVTPFAVSEPACATCAGAGGDSDGDEICDPVDNCPTDPNGAQTDGDGDGVGDVCDACPADPDNDIDGDAICGDVDVCPFDPDNDVDGDGVCGDVDNCPADSNPGQEDADSDGTGDVCDVTDIAGLSIRKVIVKSGSPRVSQDRWQAVGELDATLTPTFSSEVDTQGVTVLLLEQGGSGLVEVNQFTFSDGDCEVRRGNILCKHVPTRSLLKLKKRSATQFFRMVLRVKDQTIPIPGAGDTPLVVSVRTLGDVDRSDEVGDCSSFPRGIRCKQVP